MFTNSRHEPTAHRSRRQAFRRVVVAALIGAGILMPKHAPAQLPFLVTWVDWSDSALAFQREAYRAEAGQHEVLFCIVKWRFEPPTDGYRRVVIERTRREASGERHRIPDVNPKCRDRRGQALPTIHTHSDGNCQLSPPDLLTMAGRDALFDGVQCGNTYFVWAFAWQIQAIASWMYASNPVVHEEARQR